MVFLMMQFGSTHLHEGCIFGNIFVESTVLNPHYALGFVAACPGQRREGLKTQENQSIWRLRHSTAMVKSKIETKWLILKWFHHAIESLLHIPSNLGQGSI